MRNCAVYVLRLFQYGRAYVSYEKRISLLLGVDIRMVRKLFKELQGSRFFSEMIKKTGIKTGFGDFSMLSVLRAPSLYVICRITKPQIVVETGVCSGFSSVFILCALDINDKGKLYSVDLPNQPGEKIPEDRPVGWLVPEGLRKRWELTLGSSREKLPGLLSNLNKIDIFYHDSEHSYENMLFEFNTSWNFIRQGGILLSDDITENAAFNQFCREKRCGNSRLFKLGIIRKD